MTKNLQDVLLCSLIIAAVTITAGCQQQDSSDTKKSRFIADENRQLKQQLEIKNQQIEHQKALLDKCAEDKTGLARQLESKNDALVNDVIKMFDEGTKQLQQENEKLKERIKSLEQRRRWPEIPSKPQPLEE